MALCNIAKFLFARRSIPAKWFPMDQQDIIAKVEGRAAKLGLSINEVCQQAGVHPTTFSRWKKSEKNPQPIGATLKSLSAITDVLDRLEAVRDAA
jgi:transcriptional regulator with XRE-family HTH domain